MLFLTALLIPFSAAVPPCEPRAIITTNTTFAHCTCVREHNSKWIWLVSWRIHRRRQFKYYGHNLNLHASKQQRSTTTCITKFFQLKPLFSFYYCLNCLRPNKRTYWNIQRDYTHRNGYCADISTTGTTLFISWIVRKTDGTTTVAGRTYLLRVLHYSFRDG